MESSTHIVRRLAQEINFAFIKIGGSPQAAIRLKGSGALDAISGGNAIIHRRQGFTRMSFLFFGIFCNTFQHFTLVSRRARFGTRQYKVNRTASLAFLSIGRQFTGTMTSMLRLKVATMTLGQRCKARDDFRAVLPFEVLLSGFLGQIGLSEGRVECVRGL